MNQNNSATGMYQVINQLKERNFSHTISNSEEAVLDFIEKNLRRIPKMTVIELTRDCFTSQATLNRTCKILGFVGFSELKYALSQDIILMDSAKTRHISSVEYYLSKIDFDSASTVAKLLYSEHRKVLLVGLGASNIAAQYFQRLLLYIGIPSIIIEQEKMLDRLQDYLMIVISSSGETMRCIQIVKRAKDLHMPVVSITKKHSTLVRYCDAAFVHDIAVDKMDGISRERQVHIIIMLNELIHLLSLEFSTKQK